MNIFHLTDDGLADFALCLSSLIKASLSLSPIEAESCLFSTDSFGQNEQAFSEQALFINGTDGYQCYRIPAIITAPNGDFLALAEGRGKGCRDYGDEDHTINGIVLSLLCIVILEFPDCLFNY